MLDIFSLIGKGLVTLSVAVASFVGIVPQNVQAPVNLSGTFQTPEVKALFTTSLASKITSSATSMTLVSATDKDGNTLASSTYGFIIDEGTSVEEFVLADCTGTTCTNMTRGISVSTATTSVAALQFEHRRGASVKITTAPSLVFVMNALKGKQNIENILRYDASVSTSTIDDDNRNLVNYELLAYTAFNGAAVVNASQTQRGVVEIATQVETASSTSAGGSTALLAIPASNATSTYNSATAALRVVTTQNNGKIDNNFISTSTLLAATSTISIGAFTAWDGFFKQRHIITSTGTSTFSVPSGITKLWVETIGAGGGGGSCSNGSGNEDGAGGGGGGGGYAQEIVNVTGTSTIQVYVAAQSSAATNGAWTTFGTNGFYLYATGGLLGQAEEDGGIGGSGVGGDVNISGSGGGAGHSDVATGYTHGSGAGGSSFYGGGGAAVSAGGGGGQDGVGGGNYGGGGSGGSCAASLDTANGGTGGQGIIIIRW